MDERGVQRALRKGTVIDAGGHAFKLTEDAVAFRAGSQEQGTFRILLTCVEVERRTVTDEDA